MKRRHPSGFPRLGPSFRRYWWAATLSSSGTGMLAVTLPLLAAAVTTSPVHVALILLALRLPWLFFGLAAGALADRVPARGLLVGADLVRMTTVAAIGTLALWSPLGLPALLAAAFLLGTAAVVFDCAAQAWLPRAVERSALGTANGRLEAGRQADMMLGPALGGLATTLAAALPLLANAATFGVSALLLRGLPEARPPASRPPARLRDDIRTGLAWLRGDRFVSLLALTLTTLAGLQSGALAVQVLLGLGPLGLSPAQYGLLVGLAASGGLAGALAATRLVRPGRLWPLPTAILAAAAGYAVLALTSSPWLAGAALAVENFGIGLGNVTIATLRMAAVPVELLGRVAAVFRILLHGAVSLGALLGGLVASAFGVRVPFLVAVAGYLLLLALVLPPLRRHRPRAPHDGGVTAAVRRPTARPR